MISGPMPPDPFAAAPPPAPSRVPRRSLLPYGWPLYALFYFFPLWWVLGLGEFVWPIFALFLLANMVVR
ncbi:MAG TPA: ligase, partial [Acidimicrobiia bacterium]|nr:ligase [Acidimicrobiia bacterium]